MAAAIKAKDSIAVVQLHHAGAGGADRRATPLPLDR